MLPETGLIFGRHSKPFSHFFYRSDPPVRTVQFIDPVDHSTLVELRGLSSDGSVGLQSVVPPSIHETGEPVRFEEGFAGTPANVDGDALLSAVHRVAAAALMARHWPTEGSRHHAFLALAGVLARADWSLEAAKAFHRVIYRCLWPDDPQLRAADTEVQSTFEKYSAGTEITGVPTLVGLVDKKVVNTALLWLGTTSTRHVPLASAGPYSLRLPQPASRAADATNRTRAEEYYFRSIFFDERTEDGDITRKGCSVVALRCTRVFAMKFEPGKPRCYGL